MQTKQRDTGGKFFYLFGIIPDNIDGDTNNSGHKGHKEYVLKIFKKAKEMGLLVGQKNYGERIGYFSAYTDFFVNEQCQEFNECSVYNGIGKPVFNIEYNSCKNLGFMYSVKKHVKKMDKIFTKCR